MITLLEVYCGVYSLGAFPGDQFVALQAASAVGNTRKLAAYPDTLPNSVRIRAITAA